jgi:hypothetical protein
MATTKEELELEERKLELEERKEALEARKLENAKLRREADKTRMDQEDKANRDKNKGAALLTQRPDIKFKDVRRTCNHLMGGKGREALMVGRGNDSQFCVVKVKLPTGDVMIRCQRCRKVWVPPLEDEFILGRDGNKLSKEQGGKLDKVAFQKAIDEYNIAYNFNTDLATVILPQYRWARGGKPINREVTHRFVAGLIGK